MSVRFLVFALLCFLTSHGVQGQAASGSTPPASSSAIAPVSEGRQPFNIKGDLLVLDVGSLAYQGNHPMGPPIGDPTSCSQYCKNTAGCSGWSYCNSTTGCGSGCETYVASNPKLQTEPNGNPTVPSPSWYSLTAIKGFGPWGTSSGCLNNCSYTPGGDYQCKPTGRWPRGMCSLKKLSNPAKPEYWSSNAGEGWVSGWIAVPQQCAGMAARTCHRCLSSKSPASCLACAKNPKLQRSLLASVLAGSYTLAPADGCATCYNQAQPDKCTPCLYTNKPCAACTLQNFEPQSGTKVDVQACIDCSNKFGAAYTGACTTCAALAAKPGAVSKCMTCVGRASKVACNETAYPVTCWNPENANSVCSTCATDAADYEACVGCVERKPYSDNCYSCATFKEAAKQAQCYACAKTSGTTTSTCADCLTYLTDPKAVNQCYECLNDPKTTADGKQWCFGCQNWCNTYELRAKCNQCLATQQENYVQACSC